MELRARADEAPGEATVEQPAAAVPQQTLIDLDFKSYEHFEDTEPTILDGENLDIPTFLRKGVRVSAAAG